MNKIGIILEIITMDINKNIQLILMLGITEVSLRIIEDNLKIIECTIKNQTKERG